MKPKKYHFANFIKAICLTVFIVGQLSCFGQSTYYVSTHGSNATGTGTRALPWATINYAINQVPAGSKIDIDTGVYTDTVLINKSVHLIGNGGNQAQRPVLQTTQQGVVGNHIMVRIVNVTDVTIENIHIHHDMVRAYQSVYAFGNFNNLALKNFSIQLYGSDLPLTDRNRNRGKQLNDYIVINLDAHTSPTPVIFSAEGVSVLGTFHHDTTHTTSQNLSYGAIMSTVFSLKNVTGNIGGPATSRGTEKGFDVPVSKQRCTMQSLYAVLAQNCGDLTIQGSVMWGGGCDIVRPLPNATTLIEDNTIFAEGGVETYIGSLMSIRYNVNSGSKIIFRKNNVQGLLGKPRDRTLIGGGINVGGSQSVYVENNIFQPRDTSQRHVGVFVNTDFSIDLMNPLPNFYVTNSIHINGNEFRAPSNPRPNTTGIGIQFSNGLAGVYPANQPAFDTLDIGGNLPAQRNKFSKYLQYFINTADSGGSSFKNSIFAQNNQFEVGASYYTPSSLTSLPTDVAFKIEDKIWHYLDNGVNGYVHYSPRNAYLTGNTGNNSLKRIVDSSAVSDTIFIAPNNYNTVNNIRRRLFVKSFPGVTFGTINVDKDTVFWSGPLKISTKLDLTTSFASTAHFKTNDTVTLAPTANYLEYNKQYLAGWLKTTRNVRTSRENFGGIGFTLEPDSVRNLGPVTVSRLSGTRQQVPLPGTPKPSIDAVWFVEQAASRIDSQLVTLKWQKGYQGFPSTFDSAQFWHDSAGVWKSFGYCTNASTYQYTLKSPLHKAFTLTNNPKAVYHAPVPQGITENKTGSFAMYPNPAKDKVTVSGLSNEHFSITVTDVFGRQILETNQREFGIASWPNGVYNVTIDTNGKRSLHRLVKE